MHNRKKNLATVGDSPTLPPQLFFTVDLVNSVTKWPHPDLRFSQFHCDFSFYKVPRVPRGAYIYKYSQIEFAK